MFTKDSDEQFRCPRDPNNGQYLDDRWKENTMDFPRIRGEKDLYTIGSLQLYSSIFSVKKQKAGRGFSKDKQSSLEEKKI